MKKNSKNYDVMLDEVSRVNRQYSDIEHITATVAPAGEGMYRVEVYCESEEMISTLVSSLEEFRCAVTTGVGMGLGVIDEDGRLITD